MPLRLSSPVTDIPRVGPAKAGYLAKLGITHARDFLYTFPRRYDDFSRITPIADLKPGEKMTVKGRVKSFQSEWGFRGRQQLLRIFVELEDDTGVLSITWYNLRFLPRQLWQGRELFVAGEVEDDKGKFRMRSPVLEFLGQPGDHTHTARITPVYSETYGVTSRFLRYQVKQLLPLMQAIPEYLPATIRRRHKLIDIHQAIRAVHFPDSSEQLAVAQRRLRFDELFFLQLSALVRRRQRDQATAFPIKASKKIIYQFISDLPYQLTKAQQTACREVAADMAKGSPMNRLLQGDVGSGKSTVAFLATHLALNAEYTVIYLAPTEILARQQAGSLSKVLGKANVALLIGALANKAKQAVKKKLAAQKPLCVVGTHALLQNDVIASNCALAIIDEQHRFGVAQRSTLQTVATQKNTPHLLSMTATPIPRTLNLTVYGDLDISILDELPPGRQPVKTFLVPLHERDQAALHILKEIHQGRQAYVIAPLIDESAKLLVKSAKETVKEMRQLFPDIAIGLLHGQMTSDEKKAAINNFNAGALQLLVSTAVVEVGIDVPNATIMIIEGAERFGLAQLHQFRGRIGRGQHQSYCYLFPSSDELINKQRLQILVKTTDGFIIAEEDLKLRGPGETYGLAQSGYSDLKVASLLDYPLIKKTRQEAETLLRKDPELNNYIILKKKVEQKNLVTHFE